MKKTLHIDERLLKEARAAARAGSDTETVQRGLEALLRDAAYQRLRALWGSEPGATAPKRRREPPVTTGFRVDARGVGWIDVHLLAAVIVAGCRLWTADPRFAAIADELKVSHSPG